MPQMHRFLPFAASAAVALLLEIVYRAPALIFFVAILLPALLFAAIYLMMGRNLKTPSARFQFLIVPVLLSWSALAFSLLLESALLRHLLALLMLVFLLLFFESLVTYIWRHEAYLGYSLENLSGYALTLTVFLAGSVLLGLQALLDLNLGLASFIFFAVMLAVHYAFFWMSKIAKPISRLYTLALPFLLLQFFLVFGILPFHFLIGGAALTVLWYTAVSVSRAHLLGLLTPKMLRRHLVLAVILLLFLLLSGVR